jgi:lysophospholipase L1-like esterase
MPPYYGFQSLPLAEAPLHAETPGLAEFRAVWIVVGILALLLHLPLTLPVLLANGAPWLAMAVLLNRQGTCARVLDVWRGAMAIRAGRLGLTGIALTLVTVAVLVSPGAAILLGICLTLAGSLIGLLWGSAVLREQLIGWSLGALGMGAVLFTLEGALHLQPVAARLGTPKELDSWWEHRYDRLWESNVLGIRSPYETLRKEPGVLRVVAIGDSFTWGDKIASSDSTWPAQFEEELRDQVPGTPVEVVNLGELGFTTVNEAEMLRRLGWQFDPDIVVVQFYLNDILPSGENFQQEFTEWLFPRAWILPERYRRGPVGSSTLLWVVEGALSALRNGNRADHAAAWTEVYQLRGPEWVAQRDALREMGRAANVRGVPIVLMLFPDFIPGAQDDPVLPFQAIHDQVMDEALDAGFSILDLTPLYFGDGGDPRRWWAMPYDEHPSSAALGVAAEALALHLLTILQLGEVGVAQRRREPETGEDRERLHPTSRGMVTQDRPSGVRYR